MTQPFCVPSGNLIFEQQKELLLLQLSHEKDKQWLELERLEMKKQVAIERLRCETEQAKIDLQATRLRLVKDGKLSREALQGEDVSSAPLQSPDIVSSLCLLPKFNERDPDTFTSPGSENLTYASVKAAVLKAYELVPEACREVKSVASGYCLQGGNLIQKWVPPGEDFVGDPIRAARYGLKPIS